ncbi:MAG: endonuclease domain-containing protein [Bacteroidota bacterium]
MNYSEIKKITATLRNNQTPSEKLLWVELRRRNLKYKFLRQHAIIYDSLKNEHFFYIPDFYCALKKLVIEVDGKIHDYHKEYDRHRSEVLNGKGLHVIRIKNEELSDIAKVISKINDVLEKLP